MSKRDVHIKEYKKEVYNLKRRIKAYEKKYGYKIDVQELEKEYKLTLDKTPDSITQRLLNRIRDIKVKVFRKFGYDPTVPDEIFNDTYSTSEPVDIADHVILELRRRIEEYQGESYTTEKGKKYTRETWDYFFDRRKDDLLSLIDNGIQMYGKNNIAMRAENLQEAYDLSTKYMDESKGEINQTYFRELGKLLFGRDFSMMEYARFEILNEYNGNYA